jgi:tryptophan halogenase
VWQTRVGALTSSRRIAVVGSTAAAWLTAAALARAIDREHLQVTVVADISTSSGSRPYPACDALQPAPDGASGVHGINEDFLVARDAASFTYGIALTGWSRPDTSYFHPFAEPGASLGPLSFHHIVRKLRKSGIDVRYANYSLASLAAQSGRFSRPSGDPGSVLSSTRYGLHVDYDDLAERVRRDATATGVTIVEGKITGISRNDDGTIAAVLLDDDRRVEAGLFVDCSNDGMQLADRIRDLEWQPWSRFFPFDRFVTASVSPDPAIAPFSQSQAYRDGWIHYVPTPHRSALTAFFSSEAASDEQVGELLQQFAGCDLDGPASGACQFGRRSVFWSGNCVAIGPAAVHIDPVGCSNLSLLQQGIDRLLRLLPGSSDTTVEAAEYNRQMVALCERARDFAFLHYKLNGRQGDPAWDAVRVAAAPSALDYTIRLYESRGQVVLYDEEPLGEASWINLFDEHGIRPRNYNRIADGTDIGVLQDHLARMRAAMIDELKKMPLHSEYLASIRASTGRDE